MKDWYAKLQNPGWTIEELEAVWETRSVDALLPLLTARFADRIIFHVQGQDWFDREDYPVRSCFFQEHANDELGKAPVREPGQHADSRWIDAQSAGYWAARHKSYPFEVTGVLQKLIEEARMLLGHPI